MLKSLVNLFFPKVCYACLNLLGDHEEAICVDCRHDLPVTNFHFDNNKSVEKVLYGRAQIKNGTALFRFENSSLCRIRRITQIRLSKQKPPWRNVFGKRRCIPYVNVCTSFPNNCKSYPFV